MELHSLFEILLLGDIALGKQVDPITQQHTRDFHPIPKTRQDKQLLWDKRGPKEILEKTILGCTSGSLEKCHQ